MDLDPIGKHCALQSCNVLDFLPIRCGCLGWFCELHILPELHHCSSFQQGPFEPSPTSVRQRPKCALFGCNNPSLDEAAAIGLSKESESCGVAQRGCPGCQLSFCVHHRHMQSHSCTGLVVEKGDPKHGVARTVFTQKFLGPSTPTSRTPVVVRQHNNLSADPKRHAQLQRVKLMRLRHKAIPGDPKDRCSLVPVDQRLHVIVCLKVTGQPTKETVLWFRKTTITGRALDLAVQHFDIPHVASIQTFYFKQSSAEGSQVLQNQLELLEQLEDGSTVVLTNLPSDG